MSNNGGGILRLTRKGGGFLFDPEWPSHEVFVSARLIRQYQLPKGAAVAGPVRRGKRQGFALVK